MRDLGRTCVYSRSLRRLSYAHFAAETMIRHVSGCVRKPALLEQSAAGHSSETRVLPSLLSCGRCCCWNVLIWPLRDNSARVVDLLALLFTSSAASTVVLQVVVRTLVDPVGQQYCAMSLGRIARPLAQQLKQTASPATQQTRSFAKVPAAKGADHVSLAVLQLTLLLCARLRACTDLVVDSNSVAACHDSLC